jgi:CheY-like chemotaxis protein
MAARPVILVVDDDPDIVALLQAVLEQGGMTVLTALGGPEAIALCREHPEISLAVIDICMPLWDGPAVFKALRRINPGIRGCLTTGMADTRASDWADLGAVRVFEKPYHLASLAESVFELATAQLEPPSRGPRTSSEASVLV